MNRIFSVTRTLTGRLTLLAVAILGGFLLAMGSSPFGAQEWALWFIYGQLALSATFVWGYGGIFTFGQGALFGLGAYAYGVAAINIAPVSGETYSALLIAAGAGALFALLLGYFMFYGEIGELYVGIITLAATLVLLTFMSSTGDPKFHVGDASLGGYNGMIGIPQLGSLTAPLNPGMQLVFVVAVAAVAVFVLDTILRRPWGRSVMAVRDNSHRAELLGYDPRRTRLFVFVIGGALAGLAGAQFAAWGQFANPGLFNLQQAALVLIWALVGGRHSLLGAFVGVVLVQKVQTGMAGVGSGDLTPLVVGATMILIVLVAPEGLMWAIYGGLRKLGIRTGRVPSRAGRRLWRRPRAASAEVPRASQLKTVGVSKAFGGVHAVEDVTVCFPPNTVTSVLGPNGAGKSTLFGLLVGTHKRSSGRILLDDTDVSRRKPFQRARLGLGIKTQVPSLFEEMTVRENVWLAAYAKVRDVNAADDRTSEILRDFLIEDRSEALVGGLAHGDRQWVEIALVVAARPRVLLLDEPTAGMTHEETRRTVDLIHLLAPSTTVVVVEHDMAFVRDLEGHVIMLHQGHVFRTGSMEELSKDEQVLDIYLGRGVVGA